VDKRVIISDLDGTLGDYGHRVEFYKKREYEQFNAEGINDRPIEAICNILRRLKDPETEIVIMTARTERNRADTERWLKLNDIPYDRLLMRPNDNHLSDADCKQKIFQDNFNYKDIWFVLEDKSSCVDMWRGEGVHCLQVAPGDM